MQSSVYCLIAFLAILFLITKPLGLWMVPMVQGDVPRCLARADHFVLKCLLIKNRPQSWYEYAFSVFFFSIVGFFALFLLLRFQGLLPLNPEGVKGVGATQAFNIAVSFVTNTNWQNYSGENTLSYFTQMAGLTVQNFLSAATGIAVAFALMRGFIKKEANDIGNFWVDVVRISLWVLLPICVVYALVLVSQGVIQNFNAYQTIQTFAGHEQTLAMGPVASQEAIKLLGTNGGGFFNANSAHPFENPTQLTNFLESLSIFAISSALTYTFGHTVKDVREGWTLWGAMAVIFILCFVFFVHSEMASSPALLSAGAAPDMMNMEGKEVRFDLAATSLFSIVTTAASSGAVNAMHDSLTPLAGMIPMWLMQMGEVVFGGAGAGFYSVMIFVLIGVFVAGLMVGRTPEYLGKKITPTQMKLVGITLLVSPLLVLIGTAVTAFYPGAWESLNNAGAHGFSEMLYAWSSAANNNGSAFAGLNANTPFFNVGLGLAMWFGRFVIISAILALAGSLAKQKITPASVGTLRTHGFLFMFFLVGVIVLVGALTYLPSLALGPIAEHLMLPPAS